MSEPHELLKLADQCVKCGYCLPVCPTFRLRHTEAESPRGRIALIQGWLSRALAPTPTLFRHLDQCLECRACESVCPSLVRFGTLMDGARMIRQQRRPWWQRWPRQLWLGALSRPRWLAALAWLGPVLRRLSALPSLGLPWLESAGLRSDRLQSKGLESAGLESAGLEANGLEASGLAPRWPRLAMMQRLGRRLHAPCRPRAPASPVQASRHPRQAVTLGDSNAVSAAHQREPAPPITTAHPPLGLFLGCVARGTQGETIAAARRLLERLNIPYREPARQGCCGALLRHHGFAAEADHQRSRNAEVFRGLRTVGLASACVLELQGEREIDAQEICAFLADAPALDQALARVAPRPLAARVMVHEPCSQRLLPGGAGAIYRLLEKIPDVVLEPLPGNDSCCGAAGTYLLEHPRTALALLAPKLAALRALRPDYLVTTNSGCALHLAGGLAAAGLEIPVLHPIELLERQLRPSGWSR